MDTAPHPAPAGAPSAEPSSLTDRLTNVIAAPGELFAEIKNAPERTPNWLVPLVLSSIVTVAYIFLAFSQPTIIRDTQEQRIHALQQKVASGQMTQAQADAAQAAVEKYVTPGFVAAIGSVTAVIACAAGLFLMAVAIWLGLKCCGRSSVSYIKMVEVCGLALVIDVPQKIIRIALVAWKGNLLATLSPTLFLAHPSTTNKTDVLLSFFDLIDFWWLAVLSLGVSKVASVSYKMAALVVFGAWFGFRIVALLLAPGQ